MRTKYRHILAFLLVATLFFVGLSQAEAQCAMCKAVAEDTIKDGYGMAMGLNAGIIFIMTIPYILIAVLFVTFFRKRIKGFLREFSNIH